MISDLPFGISFQMRSRIVGSGGAPLVDFHGSSSFGQKTTSAVVASDSRPPVTTCAESAHSSAGEKDAIAIVREREGSSPGSPEPINLVCCGGNDRIGPNVRHLAKDACPVAGAAQERRLLIATPPPNSRKTVASRLTTIGSANERTSNFFPVGSLAKTPVSAFFSWRFPATSRISQILQPSISRRLPSHMMRLFSRSLTTTNLRLPRSRTQAPFSPFEVISRCFPSGENRALSDRQQCERPFRRTWKVDPRSPHCQD